MAKKILRKITINRVALVDMGSNPGAEIMLFKSKAVTPPQPEDKEFTDMKIDKSKYTQEEQTQLAALLAKGGVTVDPEPVTEDVIKTLAPEVQAMIKSANDAATKAQADAAKAIEQANEATATAQLEKAAREETEFVAANQPIIKAFPGAADANTKLLFRVKKAVKPEDYTALEVLMKAGNEALTKLTEAELGHGENGRTHGSAYEELKKKAEDLAKEKGWKFAKAFEHVSNENPDLVAEYRESRGVRVQ